MESTVHFSAFKGLSNWVIAQVLIQNGIADVIVQLKILRKLILEFKL